MKIYFVVEALENQLQKKLLLEKIIYFEERGIESLVCVPYQYKNISIYQDIRNIHYYDKTIHTTWMECMIGRITGLGILLKALPKPDLFVGVYFPHTCLYIRTCIGYPSACPIISWIDKEPLAYKQAIYYKYADTYWCSNQKNEEQVRSLLGEKIKIYGEEIVLEEIIASLSVRSAIDDY